MPRRTLALLLLFSLVSVSFPLWAQAISQKESTALASPPATGDRSLLFVAQGDLRVNLGGAPGGSLSNRSFRRHVKPPGTPWEHIHGLAANRRALLPY
jgi:hypothetical protein